MKTWIKTTLAATLLGASAIVATPIFAWGGHGPYGGGYGGYYCDGSGPRGKMSQRMDPAQIEQRLEARLTKLQGALSIRPEQAAAWESFKSAALDKMGKRHEQMLALHKEGLPKTTPERLERMERYAKDHLQAMDEMHAAVRALYAKLDDAQKATFDQHFPFGPMGGKGGPGMRQGGGPGMGMGPGMQPRTAPANP